MQCKALSKELRKGYIGSCKEQYKATWGLLTSYMRLCKAKDVPELVKHYFSSASPAGERYGIQKQGLDARTSTDDCLA